MFILEYKGGEKPEELSSKVKANMERCANFLVEMIEKYGREVLEEVEAGERATAEKQAQQERLREYADYKNHEIASEYCDAGKSGKNITGRPEYSQMLNDVAEDRDGVDFILVLSFRDPEGMRQMCLIPFSTYRILT